jgi:hypothetical protein
LDAHCENGTAKGFTLAAISVFVRGGQLNQKAESCDGCPKGAQAQGELQISPE